MNYLLQEVIKIPLHYKHLFRKLKISVLILITGICFASANNVISQEAKLSFSLVNMTIQDVINEIERNSDYIFVRTDNAGNEINKRVTVNVSEMPVEEILDNILSGTGLSYQVIDKQIVIYHNHLKNKSVKEEPVINHMPQPAKIQLNGHIADTNGEPLIGVSIQIKGTTSGTVSDVSGNYSLQVEPGNVLIFSYIGYVTQEIPVNNQTTINVKLAEDTQALNEVVVVGYGTLKKKEVTSAVETIRPEKFNAGGSRNPLDLIQGKIAGLTMTRTSNPNVEPDYQLRGVASISGGKSPLIVIDGVPVVSGGGRGYMSLIQQDDIESFSILKDGSAAAIYGTRGNAGVILITTKKGKSGSAQFDYSGYVQHEMVTSKPDYLNASDFRGLIKQGIITEAQDYGASTDLWNELINKNNISHYHNLAMSGGTTNTNYRASIYFNEAQGIAKENGNQQYGGRVNINQKGLQDRLTMSLNLATNLKKENRNGGSGYDFEQAIQRNPTMPLYNEDGSFYEVVVSNTYNPMSRLAYRTNERNRQTTSADLKIRLDLMEGLSVSAFGAHLRDSHNERYYRSSKDFDNRVGTDYQGMGYASKANLLEWTNTFESMIDYRKTFNDKHVITGLLGYSYQYSTTETFSVNNSGFTTDGFEDWNLGAGSAIQNTQLPRPGMASHKEENKLIAFFGRINYSYADKYHLQAILRHEGSSRFGANHKWGNFPSISAGWSFSEEEFMKEIYFIDNMKFRVGYGVTGNQEIPNYLSLVTLETGGVYPQNGVYYQTYGAGRNPNPDLRWEQKRELNFGLDYSLLNRRITGSIDVYNRTTKDLLYEYMAQQPPYVRDKIFTNVGSLRSTGVELQLSAIALDNKDFQWFIDFAGSTGSNKLTKLSNDFFSLGANWLSLYSLPAPGALGNAIRLEEGGKVGNFYGKRFAGFTEDGKWLFYKKDGTTGRASEMNENDNTVIGNGIPKVHASLGTTLKYKAFDLTIMFRGKFGFDILNLPELYFGNKKWLPQNLLKSAITKHQDLNDDPQYSDYYIEKGDFVKLDNLTLGYNFNLKTPYIRNLRIYATGKNLFTITGYSGMDPEIQDTGIESTGIDTRDFYPRTRSISFGLNIGF